ncbi:hypothetical protein FRC02_008932 [Tulasnella sp. 418]|nr:hypothetical protein FRC02_008932 [Tulasnella sp. 418]
MNRYGDYDNGSRLNLNSDYSQHPYPPQDHSYNNSAYSFANSNSQQGNYSPVDSRQYPNAHMDNNNNHGNYSSGWAEKTQTGNRKSKMIVIGSIIGLIVIIAIGVGVGVAVSNNNKKGSSSSTGSTSSGDTKGWVMSQNNVVKYNPKDLSQFEKDTRLKKSLYGMAYMPEGAIMPACGATFEGVLEDVMLMSQLTTRIRLYGTDCNQTGLVMEAIKQTKTDLTVYMGIYINDDDTVYTRQRDEVKKLIETYGTDHIAGVTVGNEYILNKMTAAGGADPTSAPGVAAAEFLVTKIQDTRSMLTSMSLPKTIPVGNGDAGSYTNTQLLSAVDYFMSNIHPWFGHLPVEQSAGWTWQFFQDNNVALAATVPNNPELFIAEVGWPTKSSDAENASNGASDASEANLQIFINDWICQANQNQTKYFWFENMDQPWKDAQFGGVEGWWGLFDAKKQLKQVTLPDCAAP